MRPKVTMLVEQAGTGPSRRHIQGSKIAKGLPSVNLQYSKIEKPKKMDRVARLGPLARVPGVLKGGTSEIVNIFVAVEGETLWKKNKFSKKSLTMPKAEKQKGGLLWDFSTSILSQNSKKIEGGTLWGKNFRSLAVPKKNERGDPLVSPGMVCYARKQEKPFWFSSLGQMVQYYFAEL